LNIILFLARQDPSCLKAVDSNAIHAIGIHASFLKTLSSIIIFSLDEQRALRPLLNSVAKNFYEIRSTNLNFLFKTNPIFGKTQINVTSVTLNNYEEYWPCSLAKANPKQTQFNPIQSQLKANQTQFKANFMPYH